MHILLECTPPPPPPPIRRSDYPYGTKVDMYSSPLCHNSLPLSGYALCTDTHTPPLPAHTHTHTLYHSIAGVVLKKKHSKKKQDCVKVMYRFKIVDVYCRVEELICRVVFGNLLSESIVYSGHSLS